MLSNVKSSLGLLFLLFFFGCGRDDVTKTWMFDPDEDQGMTPSPDMTSASDLSSPKLDMSTQEDMQQTDAASDVDMPPVEESKTHFVTKWKAREAFLGQGVTIELFTGEGEFLFDVDWDGDGVFDEFGLTKGKVHTYSTPGIYTVRIRGKFPHFLAAARPDQITGYVDWPIRTNAPKLLSVEQWGTGKWGSFKGSFAWTNQVRVEATDSPDLTNVKSMAYAFYNATSFTNMTDVWDMSSVTDMSFMFLDAVGPNMPMDKWDVSNVTNMEGMFSRASFIRSLNSWDTSSVTNMKEMFNRSKFFDQPLNSWDVSNVLTMESMFAGTLFDQPLDQWDVSNVTNMSAMFADTPFNQPLGMWNTSKVTNMAGMFAATSFNQPLNSWDVSNVTNMSVMFRNSRLFNQPLNKWDVSKVTHMIEMFYGAKAFNQDVGMWDMSSATDLSYMLDGSGVSTENYDAILKSWSMQANLPENLTLGAKGLTYCTSEFERTLLETMSKWSIVGDAKSCP